MDVQISKTHQTIYRAIFQHPATRDLQWRDVRSMLSAIADVEEELWRQSEIYAEWRDADGAPPEAQRFIRH